MPREEMKRPLIRGRGAGSRPLEASTSDPYAPVVGVLGTGDFSRSLTGRLVASGYQVVVGSRCPKRSLALFPEEAEVGVTLPTGWARGCTNWVVHSLTHALAYSFGYLTS